jgi:SpoVK/Ycf46/Vps4 family AAA+-type ATPase
MATAEQLKALIRSHTEGDDERFSSVALQVAAHAARTGHTKLAQEVRDIIDEARPRTIRRPGPVPVVQPRGELAGLLSAAFPSVRLAEMALEPTLERILLRVLREQREREKLREHGLEPQRKLLLVGPPGTGKTMTASMLAGELGLPMFTIQMHALMTRFMGETAAKLRLVFDAIQQTRAVYLFDEFDALGADRAMGNDVGEMRRVLTSFLVLLEQDASDSLIIGATNHADALDRALFRRFDAVITYELPSAKEAVDVMQTRLALLPTSDVDWQAAANAAQGLSHGELVMACQVTAKDVILDAEPGVTTAHLVRSLHERRKAAG